MVKRVMSISGYCRFLRVRLAAWEDCKVMTEPGLLMDSTYSLPMEMIYSSPGLTGRSRKSWHRYPADPGGRAGRPTVHGYAFLWFDTDEWNRLVVGNAARRN